MKKSYLLVAALLVVLVIVIAGGISMMDRDAPAPVSNSSSSKASSAKSSSAAAAPAGANSGITMTYRCTVGSTETTLNSLNEVWANPDADCIAKQSPGTPNQAQKRALEEAYGPDGDHSEKLAGLFQLCATTTGDVSSGIFADSDVKGEMLAAYKLCPLHPNKAAFEKVLAEDSPTAAASSAAAEAEKEKAKAESAAREAEAEAKKAQEEKARAAIEAREKAYADGTRVDEGNYLVGTDVQPGTWQTVATKVTDCYWEISDAQGEIIDNNFINTAPQFSITIPATAAGFTISGCSFQRIGD